MKKKKNTSYKLTFGTWMKTILSSLNLLSYLSLLHHHLCIIPLIFVYSTTFIKILSYFFMFFFYFSALVEALSALVLVVLFFGSKIWNCKSELFVLTYYGCMDIDYSFYWNLQHHISLPFYFQGNISTLYLSILLKEWP